MQKKKLPRIFWVKSLRSMDLNSNEFKDAMNSYGVKTIWCSWNYSRFNLDTKSNNDRSDNIPSDGFPIITIDEFLDDYEHSVPKEEVPQGKRLQELPRKFVIKSDKSFIDTETGRFAVKFMNAVHKSKTDLVGDSIRKQYVVDLDRPYCNVAFSADKTKNALLPQIWTKDLKDYDLSKYVKDVACVDACVDLLKEEPKVSKERIVKIVPDSESVYVNESYLGSELHDWLEDVYSILDFDSDCDAKLWYLTMIDGVVTDAQAYYHPNEDGNVFGLECETHTPESFFRKYARTYGEIKSGSNQKEKLLDLANTAIRQGLIYEFKTDFDYDDTLDAIKDSLISNLSTTMSASDINVNLLEEIQVKQFFEDVDNQNKIAQFVEDFTEGHEGLERVIKEVDRVRGTINCDRHAMNKAIRENDVKTIKRLLEEREATIEYVANFCEQTIGSLAEAVKVPFDVTKKFNK